MSWRHLSYTFLALTNSFAYSGSSFLYKQTILSKVSSKRLRFACSTCSLSCDDCTLQSYSCLSYIEASSSSCKASFDLRIACRRAILRFLFFITSLLRASFLAWSVGFLTYFPLLVVLLLVLVLVVVVVVFLVLAAAVVVVVVLRDLRVIGITNEVLLP